MIYKIQSHNCGLNNSMKQKLNIINPKYFEDKNAKILIVSKRLKNIKNEALSLQEIIF